MQNQIEKNASVDDALVRTIGTFEIAKKLFKIKKKKKKKSENVNKS